MKSHRVNKKKNYLFIYILSFHIEITSTSKFGFIPFGVSPKIHEAQKSEHVAKKSRPTN
jgi:hypothetical protein